MARSGRGYGTRGGTSATAGKKARYVVADVDGARIRVRTFFDTPWLTVHRPHSEKPWVVKFYTEDEARQFADSCRNSYPDIRVVEGHFE